MKLRSLDIEPHTEEEIAECATIEGMRKRINIYSHHDALTRAVLAAAWHRGLSGEDTMTLLAFEALRSLEKLTDAQIERAMLEPSPPIIFNT